MAFSTFAVAQQHPNFTGLWRLDPDRSRMVGAGGRVGPGPQDREITWIIAHGEPRISVTVNVKDRDSSHEFSFDCTTDGNECTNYLPDLNEIRRMRASWAADTLLMTQTAHTPRNNFETADRLYLSDDGQELVFERIITDTRGERVVRQVFRKQ